MTARHELAIRLEASGATALAVTQSCMHEHGPNGNEHYHVWRVAEDSCGRRRVATRHGRFGSRAAAQQWGRRWAKPYFWVRKCDWPDECESRPVTRQAR